jgi:hypothetical protein
MINVKKSLNTLKGLEFTTGNSNILKEPLKDAVEALGKQTPKKIQSDSCCKNVCPSCGGAVHKVLQSEVYCQYCGQLIDWERNEDEQ